MHDWDFFLQVNTSQILFIVLTVTIYIHMYITDFDKYIISPIRGNKVVFSCMKISLAIQSSNRSNVGDF